MLNLPRRGILSIGKRLIRGRDRRFVESRGDLPRLLHDYIGKSKSTGCSWSGYAALYKRVRTLRPREILECGTGVSTVVLAYALAENAREDGESGRVTSMEEHEGWYEMAWELLPASLKEFVDLRLSPTVECKHWLFRGMRFRDLPKRPFTFIFVDGPSTRAPSDGISTSDLDVLHVIAESKQPVSAIIDGRLQTCYVLQQMLGHRFRFDALRNHGLLEGCISKDLENLPSGAKANFKDNRRVLGNTRFHPTP
ncbi:MAG: class I SAM-dependent methyltransferase [Gammaproteobacteria bacterium]|nr:class I SAM-dependent methyltransferase [Gammaproteobacteria bacterium]